MVWSLVFVFWLLGGLLFSSKMLHTNFQTFHVLLLCQHYGDVLTGGGGRAGGGGGGGSLMTWINRKSKRASARSPSGDVHRHTQTYTLKPCQDKRRRGWRRWFVTGDWVIQRRPSACLTVEMLLLPGCFVTATGTPSPRWLLITRILLVNQHRGPPVQNKGKLKINLLTGESLGHAPLPV